MEATAEWLPTKLRAKSGVHLKSFVAREKQDIIEESILNW